MFYLLQCSNNCGPGVQVGVLRCKNATTGKKVDESCCEGQVQPDNPVRNCYSHRRGNCDLKWHTSKTGKVSLTHNVCT